jgi:hypothetical protein
MARGYNERKMEILESKDLGRLNDWQGRTLVQTYSYDGGPVSIRVVMEGKTQRGKAYQSKIMGGLPFVLFAKEILPALTEMCMLAVHRGEPTEERKAEIKADIKKTLRLA